MLKNVCFDYCKLVHIIYSRILQNGGDAKNFSLKKKEVYLNSQIFIAHVASAKFQFNWQKLSAKNWTIKNPYVGGGGGGLGWRGGWGLKVHFILGGSSGTCKTKCDKNYHKMEITFKCVRDCKNSHHSTLKNTIIIIRSIANR